VFFVWLNRLFLSRISVWFFVLKFSMTLFNSSFTFCVVFFISYVSFFIVSFYSLWCLLKSSLSSFTCFNVFLCSLFLVSQNILSPTSTFLLTMSSIFSMSFSLTTFMISSLRDFFCGHHWA
jgi:hypothetical protein